MLRQISRRVVLAALLMLLPGVAWCQSTVTVFAAASLTDSLRQAADAWHAKTGNTATLSFGASSTLARQIDEGAAADLFISADTDWMDYLQKDGRIDTATRKNLLGNQLVLVSAKPASIAIAPHFDLAALLQGGKLALADPDSVPAGKYGKASLTALGVWDSVKSNLAPAENVRVALEYVARGEAPFGIVYATDAKIEPTVHVAGIFPENTHAPIVYPIALTKTASPLARDFLAFLSGPDAQAIFTRAGFTLLH
ncbi:MAG TPA: molybdate ABC transporter substrate-binding protein [Rhizomicrobium sp.]|nr:molybdate ABC transporter substrate-binding protein [Rhizomicrobium sp.]